MRAAEEVAKKARREQEKKARRIRQNKADRNSIFDAFQRDGKSINGKSERKKPVPKIDNQYATKARRRGKT
jgi:polyribonucleotide nucleotidyltransferase